MSMLDDWAEWYLPAMREHDRKLTQEINDAVFDLYLGQGATASIWFSPHSEDPAKLQNALAERPDPQESDDA